MRQLALTIILSAGLSMATAAPNNESSVRRDTLAMAVTADSVMLYQTPNVVLATLYGVDGDTISMVTVSRIVDTSDSIVTLTPWDEMWDRSKERFDKKPHKPSNWKFAFGGAGFGFSQVCGAPKGMDVQFFKSLTVSMLYVIGAKYNVPNTGNGLSFGLGIDWRRYRATYPSKCIVSNDGVIELGEYPADVIPKFSELRTFSLIVPVLWRQQLPIKLPGCANMSLAVGPIVDFNVHGSMGNYWTNLEGNQVKRSTNHIHQKVVTVEMFGALYINSWLGVYLRYTPMNVLHKPNLQFTSFSSGLICSF